VIFAGEDVLVTEVATVFDEALGVGPVWDGISAGEFVAVSLDVLSVFGLSEATVQDYGTVFDPIIDLFVSDSVGVTEVVITPFGVIVGDDAYVNGALTDYVAVVEFTDIVIPFLDVSVADDIIVTEWATVFDIVIELGIVFDEITVEEFVLPPVTSFDIFVWDEIFISEYVIAGYPLKINVADDILIIEYELVLQQAYDLYPRLYNVCPRRRIFTRDKRKVKL